MTVTEHIMKRAFNDLGH